MDCPPVGLVLGLILGALLEERLRRSLAISDGSYMIFLERPISAVLTLLLFGVLARMLWTAFRRPARPDGGDNDDGTGQ